MNRSAQFSTHDVSCLSKDLDRKVDMHVPKHRSVSVLYMLPFYIVMIKVVSGEVVVLLLHILNDNITMRIFVDGETE